MAIERYAGEWANEILGTAPPPIERRIYFHVDFLLEDLENERQVIDPETIERITVDNG